LLYIITALKSEAQAFVDKYKLQKSSLKEFTLFQNDKISLIVSGIGVDASREATQALINSFDISDDDIYLNIGICGAATQYKIGELLSIGSIIYQEINYSFKGSPLSITCVNRAIDSDEYEIVDMESFGFYDAVIHSPAIKNMFILKVVSDHFQPQSVTKEKTKMLIFNQIDAINKLIKF